jgi:hypothetical protein
MDRAWKAGKSMPPQPAGGATLARVLSARLCTFLGSGPCPEYRLVGYELERVIEGQDDAAHVINILPFAPV